MNQSIVRTYCLTSLLLAACTTPERDFAEPDAASVPEAEAGDPSSAVSVSDAAMSVDANSTDADTHSSDGSATGIEIELQGDAATMGTDNDAGNGDASMPAEACREHNECDDGNPCNGEERCESGACEAGTLVKNGAFCDIGDGEDRVCRDGNCLTSRCGDGIVDERWNEQCDDANAINGDGCDLGCVFSCSENIDCDDSNICNGAETCDQTLRACVAGTQLDDQVSCGEDYACNNGRCLSVACGNGTLDTGEECDDGNVTDNDGCNSDCTYGCSVDTDCDDGNVCNGAETCNLETRACQAGTALTCEDNDECTTNSCDPTSGCSFPLLDVDGDGQASDSLGTCGLDCNDDNKSVFTGAGELCDSIDNNCDGRIDETAPVWYPDCDGDGFAPAEGEGIQQCDSPRSPPSECPRGFVGAWTARSPKEGADCWDTDPDVYPSNTAYSAEVIANRPEDVDYDYNCNKQEEPLYTAVSQSPAATCSSSLVIGTDLTSRGQSGVKSNDTLLYQLGDLDIQPAPVIGPILSPCFGAAGWVSARAPECGGTALYSYCSAAAGACVRVENDRAQQCR